MLKETAGLLLHQQRKRTMTRKEQKVERQVLLQLLVLVLVLRLTLTLHS